MNPTDLRTLKTVEAWAEKKRPEDFVLAAARALKGWAIGKEVAEEDFDEALKSAGAVQLQQPAESQPKPAPPDEDAA